MILFPGETLQDRQSTFQGAYGGTGGAERFAEIDANIINVKNLTASNISTGTLDASVVTVTNLNASNITSGTLSADRIASNSITAAKLNVSTLSAITANMGDVVVGGSSDANGTISVKNSAGTEITKLNRSGVIVRNQQGLFFEGTTSGQYWDFQVNSSNQSVMSLASANQFFIYDYAGTNTLFSTSSSKGPFTAVGGLGWLVGNGNTSSNPGDSARVIKSGTAGNGSDNYISSDSYKAISISFGYTFSSNPFVVAMVTYTDGSLGGVHEWNVSADSFSTTGCTLKFRNVNYASGTGYIQADWIAIGQKNAV